MVRVLFSYLLDPENSSIIEDIEASFDSLESLEAELENQREDSSFCGYQIIEEVQK